MLGRKRGLGGLVRDLEEVVGTYGLCRNTISRRRILQMLRREGDQEHWLGPKHRLSNQETHLSSFTQPN